MAIRPDTLYPAQIITSDDGWPYGRPQNDAVPGDGSGTPLEEAWVSDLFGWQQALIAEAGLWPSGNPDRVGSSQYMTALHGLFADKSVETRMPDTARGAPVARTGLIIPSDFIGDPAHWTIAGDGQDNYWVHGVAEPTIVPSAGILRAGRRVPRGFSLSSVSVHFQGPAHAVWPPEVFPTITVYSKRMNTTGTTVAIINSLMTPASQAAYEARGLWTMDADPVGVFSEDYDYLDLRFIPEHGTNALAGTRVYGATIYGTIDRARAL